MTSASQSSITRARRRRLAGTAGALVAVAAVAGSIFAAFTDDARLLKLALVGALWVAVLALFALEAARRRADSAATGARDQRQIYELELEREVAARREHELVLERQVRDRVTAQGRLELDGLREDLRVLRDNLSVLLSGDLPVERVSLRAESTRLRELPESPPPRPREHDEDPLTAETVVDVGTRRPDPLTDPLPPWTPGDDVAGGVDDELARRRPRPHPGVPAPRPNRRRAAQDQPASATEAPRSVSDLIAAYGSAPPRERHGRHSH